MAKKGKKGASALVNGNAGWTPNVTQTRKLKSRVDIKVTPGLK